MAGTNLRLYDDQHVYIAIFRCPKCNRPCPTYVVTNGPYLSEQLAVHNFLAQCDCGWESVQSGNLAVQISQLEWNFQMYYDPHTWNIAPLPTAGQESQTED